MIKAFGIVKSFSSSYFLLPLALLAWFLIQAYLIIFHSHVLASSNTNKNEAATFRLSHDFFIFTSVGLGLATCVLWILHALYHLFLSPKPTNPEKGLYLKYTLFVFSGIILSGTFEVFEIPPVHLWDSVDSHAIWHFLTSIISWFWVRQLELLTLHGTFASPTTTSKATKQD